MSHVAINTPGDGPRPLFQIPSLLERTGQQLAILRGVLEDVAALAGEDRIGSDGGVDLPEDLQTKAADSAVRILHQIDNIVEDMVRWDSGKSVVEKQYEELLKAAAEQKQAEAFNEKLNALPSSRLPIHLHQYAEGRWGAYLVQNGAASLVASSNSIQGALDEFNRVALLGDFQQEKAGHAEPKPSRSKRGPKGKKSSGPA